jgi:hypothetical protein
MIIVDELMKWFTTKKNMYSLGAFVAIMLLLAWNFSYWAGAIDIQGSVIGSVDGTGEEGEEENWVYELDVDDSHSGSFLVPSGGVIVIVGTNTAEYPFEVQETAGLGFVNVTMSGTHARPDLDLRVYGPDGGVVGESTTSEADEHVELDEKDFNRTGPGTYRAEVENYSTFNVDYTLTIQIFIKVPIENVDEGE